MGTYDTSDLHGRQHAGDQSRTVLGSTAKSRSRRWQVMLLPVAVLGLGILLAMWGPLPGLGVMMTLGGSIGLVITAGLLLTDGFS